MLDVIWVQCEWSYRLLEQRSEICAFFFVLLIDSKGIKKLVLELILVELVSILLRHLPLELSYVMVQVAVLCCDILLLLLLILKVMTTSALDSFCLEE